MTAKFRGSSFRQSPETIVQAFDDARCTRVSIDLLLQCSVFRRVWCVLIKSKCEPHEYLNAAGIIFKLNLGTLVRYFGKIHEQYGKESIGLENFTVNSLLLHPPVWKKSAQRHNP